MRVETLNTWEAFKSFVGTLCSYPGHGSENHFFRGIKDSSLLLVSTLDRWKMFKTAIERAENENELLKQFPRALRQRGIFLRAKGNELTQYLDAGLVKFVLPTSQKNVALEELDSMTINATNLFTDYDGVARTATDRLSRRV